MRIYKKTTLLVLMVIAFSVLTIIAASHQTGQNQATSNRPEDATLLREGEMTAKQRAHSKLYKHYRGSRNIIEEATRRPEFKIVVKSEPEPASIKQLVCAADGIITGVIKSKSSQLTEDNNFIFTDYELIVDEVLKDNRVVPINHASPITITYPGGVINLKGKTIRAVDESFKPLAINEKFLLFVRYLPETGAYQVINSAGSFQIENEKVVQRRKKQLLDVNDNENDLATFKIEITTTLTLCTSEKVGASR